jgi:Alpha/beta hydrolase family
MTFSFSPLLRQLFTGGLGIMSETLRQKQQRANHAHSLGTPNDSITGALILVHGAGRDPQSEFRSVLASAFLAGTLENTLIVAPRFAANDGASCKDSLAASELNWGCDIGNGDWRTGGAARNDPRVSSFDAIDSVLLKITAKSLFPNLKSIVIAGHSAGGQFVNLYQMVNQVHERLGLEISYVIANSSMYAYLDNRRPAITPSRASSAGAAAPRVRGPDAKAGRLDRIDFAPFNRGNCPSYGNWPFGLGKRTGYAAQLSESQLKEQASRRPVTYLLSELDVAPYPPGGFFGSCAAMAQGNTRLARGKAFALYMAELNQAAHKLIVLYECGHEPSCVYTSEDAQRVLFLKR